MNIYMDRVRVGLTRAIVEQVDINIYMDRVWVELSVLSTRTRHDCHPNME